MARAFRLLLGATLFASIAMTTAQAQPAPPAPPPVPDGPRYVVTYVEVMPTAATDGAALVRAFRDASRKEPGNLRLEAGQRIGQPNQFVILEAWSDQASFDAHDKGAPAAQFRDKLKAVQNAPYDQRLHYASSVGPLPVKFGRDAIMAVTHVDVIPPQRENGAALVKQLADDSRKDDGNLRFEAVTQTARQNHFTLVEAWSNRKTADAHGMNANTRTFRDKLAPASGALFDQRFYKPVD
ncbi:MAG TPA: antibiotic biosynthesis monooxygenase [Xanthobacteraceae bacterium]|jgi:quinol monooxygenase YgiN